MLKGEIDLVVSAVKTKRNGLSCAIVEHRAVEVINEHVSDLLDHAATISRRFSDLEQYRGLWGESTVHVRVGRGFNRYTKIAQRRCFRHTCYHTSRR